MTVGTCRSIILSGLMDRTPGLRYGFVEASSQRVPYLLADLKRRLPSLGKEYRPDLLKQQRLYVTMQSDDDVDYVLCWAGEDNLVIGTDYGHTDQSSEIEALRQLRQNEQMEPRVIEKIWSTIRRRCTGFRSRTGRRSRCFDGEMSISYNLRTSSNGGDLPC